MEPVKHVEGMGAAKWVHKSGKEVQKEMIRTKNFLDKFCGREVIQRSLLNYWVMHPVARVSINIYIETSVRNKCRCSFHCALLTLHVSAPIGGHLQVVL
jgi:hypothetical protein